MTNSKNFKPSSLSHTRHHIDTFVLVVLMKCLGTYWVVWALSEVSGQLSEVTGTLMKCLDNLLRCLGTQRSVCTLSGVWNLNEVSGHLLRCLGTLGSVWTLSEVSGTLMKCLSTS